MSTFLMVIVTLLAFIIIPILLVMAFVTPSKLNLITTKHPTGRITRKKFLLGLLIGWIASIALGIAVTPDANIQTAPVAAVKSTDKAAPVSTVDKADKKAPILAEATLLCLLLVVSLVHLPLAVILMYDVS